MRADGVWVAFYSDHSDQWIYPNEVGALRKAVQISGNVVRVPYGMSPREAIEAAK